jgi:hypothetical protein
MTNDGTSDDSSRTQGVQANTAETPANSAPDVTPSSSQAQSSPGKPKTRKAASKWNSIPYEAGSWSFQSSGQDPENRQECITLAFREQKWLSAALSACVNADTSVIAAYYDLNFPDYPATFNVPLDVKVTSAGTIEVVNFTAAGEYRTTTPSVEKCIKSAVERIKCKTASYDFVVSITVSEPSWSSLPRKDIYFAEKRSAEAKQR